MESLEHVYRGYGADVQLYNVHVLQLRLYSIYSTFGICKAFITHRIINSNRETEIEQVLTDVRHHVNHRAVWISIHVNNQTQPLIMLWCHWVYSVIGYPTLMKCWNQYSDDWLLPKLFSQDFNHIINNTYRRKCPRSKLVVSKRLDILWRCFFFIYAISIVRVHHVYRTKKEMIFITFFLDCFRFSLMAFPAAHIFS